MIPVSIIVSLAIIALVTIKAIRRAQARRAVATSPPPPTSPTPPAPAPIASARNWGWIWWLIIIIAIVFVGRWIWYEGRSVRSTYSPPQVAAPKPQKLYTNIDPLSFNRQKSRGVRVEKTDGFTTIIVKPEPEGELVYDFDLASTPQRNGFVSADYYLREILPQYAGYRINDIRHNEEYLFGSGLTRLGPELREFRSGKNEFALFSKGKLRINGDENITIYQR